jgi:hypothetical protein
MQFFQYSFVDLCVSTPEFRACLHVLQFVVVGRELVDVFGPEVAELSGVAPYGGMLLADNGSSNSMRSNKPKYFVIVATGLLYAGRR